MTTKCAIRDVSHLTRSGHPGFTRKLGEIIFELFCLKAHQLHHRSSLPLLGSVCEVCPPLLRWWLSVHAAWVPGAPARPASLAARRAQQYLLQPLVLGFRINRTALGGKISEGTTAPHPPAPSLLEPPPPDPLLRRYGGGMATAAGKLCETKGGSSCERESGGGAGFHPPHSYIPLTSGRTPGP